MEGTETMGLTTFTQDQAEVRANYVNLHNTTGESYDSIAQRLEDNVGDYSTAERVRALADEDTGDVQADPAPRTAGDVPPAEPTGVGLGGEPVDAPAAPEATPAKSAPKAEWVDHAAAVTVAKAYGGEQYPSAAALETAQRVVRVAFDGLSKDVLVKAFGSTDS